MRGDEVTEFLIGIYEWLPELELYLGKEHAAVFDITAAAEDVYVSFGNPADPVVAVDLMRPMGGATIVVFRMSDFARIGRWDLEDNVASVRIYGSDVYAATGHGSNFETYGQLYRFREGAAPEPLLSNAWEVADCCPDALHLHVLLGGKDDNDGNAYAIAIPWGARFPVDVSTLPAAVFPSAFTQPRDPGGVIHHLQRLDACRRASMSRARTPWWT
jgi:hypothetical protein